MANKQLNIWWYETNINMFNSNGTQQGTRFLQKYVGWWIWHHEPYGCTETKHSLTRWLAVSENWQKQNTVCQNRTHLLPFGVISLHLILSLTFLFFTPTLRISSTTSSMNLLCGLPLFLWHGSSILLVKMQNSDLGLHVWGICLGYFN